MWLLNVFISFQITNFQDFIQPGHITFAQLNPEDYQNISLEALQENQETAII